MSFGNRYWAFFMGKSSLYYEQLHRNIARKVSLTEAQVRFIRDFHFRLNATPDQMLDYIEKKLVRKKTEGKKNYCRGLIEFLNNMTESEFKLIIESR